MNDRQSRTDKTFRKVWGFLGDLPAEPPPPAQVPQMRDALASRRSRIGALATQQRGARAAMKDATREIEALRQQIRRERMKAIVRIAKATLKFAPGESIMAVPPTRSSSEVVVKRASQMLKVMKTHAKLLARAGVSQDFAMQFHKETERLKAESGRVANAKRQYTRVTRSLAKEFADGMRALTHLEGILIAHYGSQSVVVRDWHGARRVQAKVGRPRGSGADGGEVDSQKSTVSIIANGALS